MMHKPIVVGIDGSPSSVAAQDLAVREAAMRRRPLRIVHVLAWPWPTFHMPDRPPPDDLEAISLLAQANTLVATAVDRARQAQPTVTVDGEVMIGFPAPVLLTESQAATLVVIGHRGLGRVGGLLLGSVAVHLTARASCPLLVSRGRPNPAGNVLLGVDAALASNPAVGMAFEEAALRGIDLDAVHTRRASSTSQPGHILPAGRHRTMAAHAEERLLAKALAEWQHKFPHVTVRQHLVRGDARQVLIDATAQAQIVVVAAHGRGGISGLLFRSTSQAVLDDADCPVLVLLGRNMPVPNL
jgi:nucleotide-binding universal stress UspA family protein